MTFYIDIILVENMIMNYIILFATGIIVKVNIKQLRLLFSSLLGSMYVVITYISRIDIYMNQMVKLLLSIVIVYISFYPRNYKLLLKEILLFYLVSFSFGGAAYYLLYFIKPVQINNIDKILTGSYPIKIAILGGILGFAMINMSFKIIKNRINKNSIFYNIEIGIYNKKCTLKVILDTGNFLVDPITSSPVVIVEKTAVEEIISKEILKNLLEVLNGNDFKKIPEELRTKCRFIPFSSIGNNSGMILGIKSDYIKIYDEEKEIIRKDVIVGIVNNRLSKDHRYSGLIGLELFNKNKMIFERQVN